MAKKIYVLYHDDSDGIAAALAPYELFKDRAKYIAVQYGQPFPDIELDEDTFIYIVDFSYKREILEEVYAKVGLLIVIDHHKTAQADLEGLEYAMFDITKSGAVLSWEWFHHNLAVPEMMLLVEDRDLWKFTLPNTRAFEEGMKASPGYKSIKYWYEVLKNDELFEETIAKGHLLVEQMDNIVASFINSKKFKLTTFRGHKIALYNTPTLISEIASALNLTPELGIDYTLSYFFTAQGELILSLRSLKGSPTDVSEIAKTLGGGGHENASGVSLELTKGLKLLEELYQ